MFKQKNQNSAKNGKKCTENVKKSHYSGFQEEFSHFSVKVQNCTNFHIFFTIFGRILTFLLKNFNWG